ncbi:MAG: tetratricopeptide repeat protein [Elusimicrobiota bacterium]
MTSPAWMLASARLIPLCLALAAQPEPSFDAEYVAGGGFADASQPLRAMELAKALERLPDLLRTDPRLHRRIVVALKRHAPDEAEALMAYFAGYRSDPCRARHIHTNIDVPSFRVFVRRTALARGRLESACGRMRAGEYKEAVRLLGRALALDPRYADAYVNRAVAEAALGDFRGAGLDYRESQKVPMGSEQPVEKDCVCDPKFEPEAARMRSAMAAAESAKRKGVEAFLKGDSGAAIAALNEAVRADPADAEAHMSRAVAYERSGNPASAVVDYFDAFELSVYSAAWDLAADAVLSAARLQPGEANLRRALQSLQRIIKSTPKEWPRREALRREAAKLQSRLDAT